MPRSTNYRRQGEPSKSTRQHNKQMAAFLPKSDAPLCQSIYDFIKMVVAVNITCLNPPVSSLKLDATLVNDRRVFVDRIALPTEPDYQGKKKSISTNYAVIFSKDLDCLNLQYRSFDWTSPASSNWNEMMIQLISKHWTHAHSQEAFSAYPIDPKHETPTTVIGVITRWFNGRRDLIRKGRTKAEIKKEKLARKKSRQRSNLAFNRTKSIKNVVGANSPCLKAFDESRCHSDTEDCPDGKRLKVQIPWRSSTFAALCMLADTKTVERLRQETGRNFQSGQLFEIGRHRSDKVEELEMVPMNLPLDCYDTAYFDSLTEQGRRELTTTPPCGLAEIHFQMMKSRSHIEEPPSRSSRS
ncbi:hypothetical protein Pst134EA_023038 [Puccinia striiformis f. sp. tritici]|uniref:hypothetical protein n=1 Tax=Puccinia striiformis f. sp. tritici TaxID=168172 RepID=UPI0020074997|nr:hypothetical protein Pst134EA_023038 [Puccinia striiformis f. sp. tritici]KAH9455579.1 hypothetical protein Pst134EA_023038 [Puccinia striiformis f. sp. tritici]